MLTSSEKKLLEVLIENNYEYKFMPATPKLEKLKSVIRINAPLPNIFLETAAEIVKAYLAFVERLLSSKRTSVVMQNMLKYNIEPTKILLSALNSSRKS